MDRQRRNLLRGMTTVTAASALQSLHWMNAQAQQASAAATDYKALVCIFLFGGNDANNMVIPVDARYSDYAAVRPVGSSIGIPQASLLALKEAGQASPRFGLHPRFNQVQKLFQAGQAAVLFNTGTLTAPLTRASFQANAHAPSNLFSHSDQQLEWQDGSGDGGGRTGWAGRAADVLGNSGLLPIAVSTGGNALFTTGVVSHPLNLQSGGLSLQGFGGDAASLARRSALDAMLQSSSANPLVQTNAGILARSLNAGTVLSGVLNNPASLVPAAFNGVNSNLAQQLQQVARIIEGQSAIGATRQVFFVDMGGYDTHTGELGAHDQLYGDLDAAIGAFSAAMAAMNQSQAVTLFTNSDFARTFKSNTGGGTDHGWGSHHFIVGGAVKGGAFYGTFPSLTLNGPDDEGSEGRWIPTTSVEQYAATLATWFGVPAASLPNIFPNLNRFATANLGFV